MRHLQIVWQGVHIHGKTMVLAGNHHRVIGQGFHRVVGTMVAGAHLHGFRPAGQRQQLMAQADTEHRLPVATISLMASMA